MSTLISERAAFRAHHRACRAWVGGLRWEYEATGAGPRGLLLLEAANDQLDRHSRESSLLHLKLQAGLHRATLAPQMASDASHRTLLFFANDELQFTRGEQDALAATYSDATVVRHLNAGRSFTLGSAWDLEKKLEVFFKAEAMPTAAPAQAQRAA
ncbi:MAG: hypothetical protein JNK82_23585 [Myxococcaceae bacterium]|nr:hypothetical protein [Myxococcaceae bacterium]